MSNIKNDTFYVEIYSNWREPLPVISSSWGDGTYTSLRSEDFYQSQSYTDTGSNKTVNITIDNRFRPEYMYFNHSYIDDIGQFDEGTGSAKIVNFSGSWGQFPNLYNLYLQGTSIPIIDVRGCDQLEDLYLSHNDQLLHIEIGDPVNQEGLSGEPISLSTFDASFCNNLSTSTIDDLLEKLYYIGAYTIYFAGDDMAIPSSGGLALVNEMRQNGYTIIINDGTPKPPATMSMRIHTPVTGASLGLNNNYSSAPVIQPLSYPTTWTNIYYDWGTGIDSSRKRFMSWSVVTFDGMVHNDKWNNPSFSANSDATISLSDGRAVESIVIARLPSSSTNGPYANITNLNLQGFTSMSYLDIREHEELTDITHDTLQNVSTAYIINTSLSDSSATNILNSLNTNGIFGGQVALTGSLMEPPSSASISSARTLTRKHWKVYTNETCSVPTPLTPSSPDFPSVCISSSFTGSGRPDYWWRADIGLSGSTWAAVSGGMDLMLFNPSASSAVNGVTFGGAHLTSSVTSSYAVTVDPSAKFNVMKRIFMRVDVEDYPAPSTASWHDYTFMGHSYFIENVDNFFTIRNYINITGYTSGFPSYTPVGYALNVIQNSNLINSGGLYYDYHRWRPEFGLTAIPTKSFWIDYTECLDSSSINTLVNYYNYTGSAQTLSFVSDYGSAGPAGFAWPACTHLFFGQAFGDVPINANYTNPAKVTFKEIAIFTSSISQQQALDFRDAMLARWP
jgi:hypothetical protein